MSYEFSDDEIREAVNAAQIYSPGYSKEQFQASRELVRCLGESGHLEAVVGIGRWEKEKGVPCTEVLDAVEQLLSKKEQLEAEVAAFEEKRARRQQETQQAKETLGQVETAIEQAREELQAVLAKRQEEEEELTAFRKKGVKEKWAIDKEVEECRREANVSKEEVVTAGQIKAEVGKSGFSLELALELSREFAGHENAREELAKEMEEHQALTNYIASLSEWAKGQKEALESELNKLKSEKDGRQAEIKDLEQARNQLENIIGQLQADVAHEEELRRFYQRYYGWSGYLEWLASWEHVFLMHCDNPFKAVTGGFDHRAGGAHVWTDKAGPKCPHCGLNTLDWDKGLYKALNLPPGTPFKIQLGE